MIAGLDWMWRFVDELFDAKDGSPSLRAEWDTRVARTLAEAQLEVPKPRRGVLGGRAGHHSEYLGHLLTEMQFLQRAYPGATW
jgi:ring-1,2-phenylacetyl-CoA epoxidase subunit PaaC